MAAKARDGDVVGVVDEDNGTVSVGVVHNGQTLLIAQKDLNSAIANSPVGDGGNDDDAGEGGES